MNTHDKKEGSSLTLVKAVEALSQIADLDIERYKEESDIVVEDQLIPFHSFQWIHPKEKDENLKIIKSTFRVILNYLKDFYENEPPIYNQKALEGIKTMMVLVGEAAKKLDKYSLLFHQTQAKSVTTLKEFKKLQEFYV